MKISRLDQNKAIGKIIGAMTIIVAILLTACQPTSTTGSMATTTKIGQPADSKIIDSKAAALEVPAPTGSETKAAPQRVMPSSSAPSPSRFPNRAQQTTDHFTLPAQSWKLVVAFDSHRQPISVLNDIKNQVIISIPKEASKGLGLSVGCNAAGGLYRLQGDVLTMDEVVGDAQMCPDLWQAETLLAQSFQGRSQLKVIHQGQSPLLIQLTDEGNVLIWQTEDSLPYQLKTATAAWLTAHQWSLMATLDNNNRPINAFIIGPHDHTSSAKLEFIANDKGFSLGQSYTLGCNWASAAAELKSGRLTRSNHSAISTMIGCGDEFEAAESRLATELSSPSQWYAVDDSVNALSFQTNENGSLLLWKGSAIKPISASDPVSAQWLTAYHWTLLSIEPARGQKLTPMFKSLLASHHSLDKDLSLNFTEAKQTVNTPQVSQKVKGLKVQVKGACQETLISVNLMNNRLIKVSLADTDELSSESSQCPAPLISADKALFQSMDNSHLSIRRYPLNGEVVTYLTQTTPEGVTLVWRGKAQ